MSNILTIDGKEYVPATTAGKHFGYTKDYLLLLIKQGYIDGQKIGNKWYVHIPSAERYFHEASAKREMRKKLISQERKAELRKYTSARKEKKILTRHLRPLETIAIFLFLFLVGSMSYVNFFGTSSQQASVHESSYGFFEYLAHSLYDFLTPTRLEVIDAVSYDTQNGTKEIVNVDIEKTAISSHVGTTTHTSIIVAPDELLTATTIESIQDSFSDPVHVSVDTENPQTGIITPVFKDGSGEAYRFMMVPVMQATTTQ